MISLQAFFYLMVTLFAIVGIFRGWAREIVVTAGLILSLFAIRAIASTAFGFVGLNEGAGLDATTLHRRQFWALTAFHLALTFVSYQGPTFSNVASQRLKARDSLQDKLLGFIVGGFNGYLVFGSILAFLEYRLTGNGFVRLAAGQPFPFSPAIIERSAAFTNGLWLQFLPPIWLGPFLLYLMVVMFLFVLIVLL